MALFQQSVINESLNKLDTNLINAAYERYCAYFHNHECQENICNAKEEQYQEGFLAPNFNLTTEYKNIKDALKSAATAIFV